MQHVSGASPIGLEAALALLDYGSCYLIQGIVLSAVVPSIQLGRAGLLNPFPLRLPSPQTAAGPACIAGECIAFPILALVMPSVSKLSSIDHHHFDP